MFGFSSKFEANTGQREGEHQGKLNDKGCTTVGIISVRNSAAPIQQNPVEFKELVEQLRGTKTIFNKQIKGTNHDNLSTIHRILYN